MASKPIVLGPLRPLNNLPRGDRLEIDEFIADNAKTNLFLLALSAMQKNSLMETEDGPNWKKYYALGAIHWEPRENWNGVDQRTGGTNHYCHHGLPTFPTWHRPYMLLYETAIYEEMVRQAERFAGPWKQTYLEAAARFRLPYWDPIMPRWPVDTSPNPDRTKVWGCPRIFLQRRVYVRTPEHPDTLDHPDNLIDNPLYSFNFPKPTDWNGLKSKRPVLNIDSSFNQKFTERRPFPEDDDGQTININTNKELNKIEGITNNDKLVDAAIRSQAASLATSLWQMLHPEADLVTIDQTGSAKVNAERSWNNFANHNIDSFRASDKKTYTTVSLENFHDTVHGLIGSGNSGKRGHMGSPNYAGFEPMFWMHHNNVDRLLSLYQALYPEKYDAAFPVGSSSLEKLYPFRESEGKFFTSANPLVRDYRVSGFAMPGNVEPGKDMKIVIMEYLLKNYYWTYGGEVKPTSLENWPKLANVAASEALQGKSVAPPETSASINALVVDNGVPRLVARKIAVTESAVLEETPISTADIVHAASAIDKALPDGAIESVEGKDKNYLPTWNAHVKVRKFAFNGSFAIHLFIGDVENANPNKYLTRKNEAGYTFVFAASGDLENCTNCKKQQEEDLIYEDVIPLTTILYDYLEKTPGSSERISQGEHRTIANLTPAAVVPFLKEQLSWRIVDLGSTPIENREREAKLDILVASREFVPPNNENLLGSYGLPTAHEDITRDKAGGHGYVYA